MKNLLIGAFLLIGSSSVYANETVLIDATFQHCGEESAMSIALRMAEKKCFDLTGYENATLLGTPTTRVLRKGWGYQGCSLIFSTSVKAQFTCLGHNK